MSTYQALPEIMREHVLPLRSDTTATPTQHARGVRAGDLLMEGASAVEDLLGQRDALVGAIHAYLHAAETDGTIGHVETRTAWDKLCALSGYGTSQPADEGGT